MFRPRFQHLAAIERRRIPPTPAGDLRLHRLERPEPWAADLVAEMRAGPPDNLYPDYAAFHERLAAFAGVPPRNVVAGLGIESLVRDLVMLCCDPGDGVAYTHPTCAMFSIYAHAFGARAMEIATDPERPPSARDIVAALSADVRLLILPNPGQPVDLCYSADELRPIARRCAELGAVLAIDEAYYGFGAPTALPLAFEFDNVVVLRTFSKAFGGAGLRVGFAVAAERIARTLDAVRQSGEIAGPSLHAATVLMDRFDSHVRPGIAAIVAGRDWLRATLSDEGYRVRGTTANHVLVEVGPAAERIAARLAERGCHVRVNAGPCAGWLMVTCGSVGLMQEFHRRFTAAAEDIVGIAA